MVKIKILIVLYCFFVFPNKAQPFQWGSVFGTGGSSDDVTKAIIYTWPNNLYVTGSFKSPTIVFGSFTLTNTNAGTSDIFIVKYNTNGTVIWANSYGTMGDDEGTCMGQQFPNIYVGGYFSSSSLTIGTNTLSNSGGKDCFVAKIDPSGNVLWANGFGGSGNDWPGGIAFDTGNMIDVVGNFDATFSIATTTLNCAGGTDICVVQYSTSGSFSTAKSYGSSSNEIANGIIHGAGANRLYVCGAFNSASLSVGTNSLINSNGGTYDAMVLVLSPILFEVTAISFGGNDDDVANALSSNNGLCNSFDIAGSFKSSSVSIGTITISNTSPGFYDVFLAKFDIFTNAIKWVKSGGGLLDDNGLAIVDDSYNSYLIGSFNSPTIAFDSQTATNVGSNTSDIFVATNLCGGNFSFLATAGSLGNDIAHSGSSIVESLYISGTYGAPSISFPTNTLNNVGGTDIFISRLFDPSVGMQEHSYLNKNLIYPNPTNSDIEIYNLEQKTGTIKIFNTDGNEIQNLIMEGNKETKIENLNPGIYFVEVQVGEVWYRKKVVVIK